MTTARAASATLRSQLMTVKDSSTTLGELPPAEPPAGQSPPESTLKRKVARNAAWNWLGVAIEALTAVFLTPFLIRRLGDSAYGTWIVIGSLTGYLGVLDFGLRGSVGRFIAFHHARGDRNGVLATLNTAAATLTVLGTLGFVLAAAAAQVMPRWADISPELLPDARLALLIAGANLALFFVTRIFDAVLWGFQRFDLLNLVDIPAALVRGVLSAAVVAQGYGLVGLACVMLGLTAGVGIAKAVLSRFVEPGLRPGVRHIRAASLREMWGYGFWNFLSSVASMARTQLGPVLIGATLGMLWVTPFSIVMRLVGTAMMLVTAGTGVLTPLATALHAQRDHERQKQLLFDSGRLCTAAALYFFALFVVLGRSLLSLWIGPHLAWVWLPLAVIAAGELLPQSVLMSENTILGMARNRSLAIRGAGECLTALILGAVGGARYGLTGVCVGWAVAATVWRGWFMLVQALRLTGISLSEYLRSGPIVSALAVMLPGCGLAAAAGYAPPESWPALCAYGLTFTALTAASYVLCHALFDGRLGIRARVID